MKRYKDLPAGIAGFLMQINAIKLNVENPFTWASGMLSPIYCDNRLILSYPEIRRRVAGGIAQIVRDCYPGTGMVAGVATGAIAIGVMVAEELDLPFSYVRSAAKGHGLGSQIEGRILPGERTVVVEDLVSTGRSSLAAVKALRHEGLDVQGMVAIFDYNLDISGHNFREADCPLISLSNYPALLDTLQKQGKLSDQQLSELKIWREDPDAWSKRRKKEI